MRAEEYTIGYDSIQRLYPGASKAWLSQRDRIVLYSLVYALGPARCLIGKALIPFGS